MKAPIRVICRPEVGYGMALAGLPILEATGGDSAAEIIDALATSPAAGGILLIEDALHDALPAALLQRAHRRGAPIIVPFPSPSLRAERRRPAEHEVLEILRRAVGYRLRLR